MLLQNLINSNPKTSNIQTIFRVLLGAMLMFAGTTHLTVARTEFLAQVPKWVPLDGDLVVVLSGIAELTLGAALIILRKYKALTGWIVAAFFVAIFPGNISQYVNHVDAFNLNTDTARAVRLLFQPPLVLWALWSSGAWQAWRSVSSGQSTTDQDPEQRIKV
ncbi:MAG TPA: hypothetical protein VHL11_24045 [Phototrophicaceae bacterium]|jgi:uncharacterized membrane protein|nr:hypothetical protein [Phototrophicaceae bacterium]